MPRATSPVRYPGAGPVGFASMTVVANRVLAVLLVLGLGGMLLFPFASHAPNRIVSGIPFGVVAAFPVWLSAAGGLLAVLLAAAALSPLARSRRGRLTVLVAAPLLLLLVMGGGGLFASSMIDEQTPAARVSLGGAFWVAVFCLMLIMMDALQRIQAGPLTSVVYALGVFAAVGVLFGIGLFDDLSILKEYANRQSAFAAAMVRHVTLVVGALAPALVIGIFLGLYALRRTAAQGVIFGTLNFLQTIPSIALFGLLIAPLAALGAAVPFLHDLGVRGIGMAPALLALTLYALLPIARNTHAGFAAVPAAVIEAARGMGMGPLAILFRVEIPLAAPILLSGLRIVVVQLIGLAVVAALIGAGGLGSFIFQGLGQSAIDLVLLGAIPTIAMAVLADAILQVFVSLSQPRGQG